MGGVFHYRCERTQTQQAQYNKFGREVGLRTGPLRGLRQRSDRIVGEQDRQQRSWGRVKVRPQASSSDEFFFSSSDTAPLELSGVFRIVVLLFVRSFYSIFFYSLHLGHPSVNCAGCHLSVCPIQCFPQLTVSGSG